MTGSQRGALLGDLFGRGAADVSDRAWLQAMLDAEAALARAVEWAGLAVPGSAAAIGSVARAELFDAGELGRQAALAASPVPALVRALTGLLPAEPAGAADAVHRGATSQDIIDTAAMLVARRALGAVTGDLRRAADRVARLATEHAGTVMAGRTLLQQAVPVTFGLVAAGWLMAIDDAIGCLRHVGERRLAVQYGGAAGTLASVGTAGPAIAARFAAELGLALPVLPWHTDRLRIVELAAALTGACAVLGKIARDVTLLAQTEVAEVAEGDGQPGRGGSSAMPHKRNPVAAICVLGCTKRAPGLLATLAAAAEQEHQRAAGAWHAEWEPLSDLIRLTSSAASWSAELLDGLRVDADRMRANLDLSAGLPLAENVAATLSPAIGRLAAHDLVARASKRAADQGIGLDQALGDDPQAAAALATAGVGSDQLVRALDPASYLGAAPEFIRRALTAHASSAQASPGHEGGQVR